MKTVDVVWMDAGHKAGWSHVNDVTAWMEDERMFTCHNVGLLMAENDYSIVLCGGESGANMWSPIRIMKKTIISIQELSYAETIRVTGDEGQEVTGGEGTEIT